MTDGGRSLRLTVDGLSVNKKRVSDFSLTRFFSVKQSDRQMQRPSAAFYLLDTFRYFCKAIVIEGVSGAGAGMLIVRPLSVTAF